MSNVIPFPSPENELFAQLWVEIGVKAIHARDAGKEAKAEFLAGLAMLMGSAMAIVSDGDMEQVRRLMPDTEAIILDIAEGHSETCRAMAGKFKPA